MHNEIITSVKTIAKSVKTFMSDVETFGKKCKPVFYRGVGRIKGFFIRVGDADEQMSEYEIYSYEAFRKRVRDDIRTVDQADEALLDFCSMPRSRREIISFVGKSPNYVTAKIIRPLVASGKLSLTMPDKPQSPKQRFVVARNVPTSVKIRGNVV